MAIVATAAKYSKLQGSGMKEGGTRLQPSPCSTVHDDMSLRRSFSTCASRGTINMALPGELFALVPSLHLSERCATVQDEL